jgi:hypothetical protein
MAATKKPKGAYPKIGGVGGVEFTGRSKAEKFENYITGIRDTSETRKDRFENTSRLYAAARKIGLSEKAVKPQIDALAKDLKKYGAAVEKKTSKMDMEDMMRRSAENQKLKAKKTAASKPAAKKAAVKITKKSAATLSRKPKAGPVVKMAKKAGKK